MAIPGLTIPGLDLSALSAASSTPTVPTVRPPRVEDVPAFSELRFEVAYNHNYTVRLTRGTAELFGTELTPNVTYTFSGIKGAIYTWHGCALEISGEAESEYVGSETEHMKKWLTAHQMLETMRDDFIADSNNNDAPRVLVVGPENVGKTSLVRCLAAWGVKMSRTPTVVNLDPREGFLSIPGSLTAVTLSSMLDLEDGWGSAPISGPTTIPVKTPLVYHYPFSSPESNTALFKPLITRAALAITSKLEEDRDAKASGIIIDTPGTLNTAKNGYENITHIISEFSINTVLVLGSERLYNDLLRRYSSPTSARNAAGEDEVLVLKVPGSRGAVNRDEEFMRNLRQQQIRTYFFGSQGPNAVSLNPHGQYWDFSDLNIYRAVDTNAGPAINASFLPGMDDDDTPQRQGQGAQKSGFEIVTPSQGMVDAILAIKFCPGNASTESIRDSCVMGFVYVAEVNEATKKVRFLAPHPSRWGDKALVWGSWPEGVGDLVA